MTRTTSPCVICQQSDRIPTQGLVCEPCRTPIDGILVDIRDLTLRIDIRPGATGPSARVSGSTEAPLPLRVDALDLTLPARQGTIHDEHHDQVGHIPVATVLDDWVRDWRDKRDRGESLPVPTVASLVHWLRMRLPWALDHHLAIDEFVPDMRHLRATLRAVAGETPPKPEQLWTPCKRCDKLALYRTPGEAYPVQCRACGRMDTEEDYQDWSRLVAAAMKREKAAA